MPSDPGAGRVLSYENLLKASGDNAGEGFGTSAQACQKLRNVFGFRKAATIEIVALAEGHGFSFAREAVKLEFPERKAHDIAQERRLFLSAEEVRLILHAFRKGGLPEKIERRVTCGHSFFSVRKLLQVCGRRGRPARPWRSSSPCGGDPETGSG